MGPSRPVRAAPSTTTMRSSWLVARGALALSIAFSSRAAGAPPLDEIEATRRICAEGPSAALARAEQLQGEAAVAAAHVLPNPTLVIEHQQTVRGPSDRETTVGLSVPLGLGGRRFVLQDAAQARREQALANARATRFEAALAFREAYAAAALDAARLDVLTQQQASLDALTTKIQGLARGGESAGYDLLRQATQARLHRRLVASMQARAAASRALLEAWTGEPVALAAVDPAKLAGGAQPRGAAPAGLGAPAAPARVEGLEAAARASALEAQAARRRWVPDVEVFAGYRVLSSAHSETGHGISLGLTVPLTFFDHGQGEAAQADAARAAAETAAGVLRRENAAHAKAAATRLGILETSAADLDLAVADAGSLEAQAGKLYAAGESSIAELLDALRAAEEARLARIDLAEEIILARLARMRALGTLLDATLDKACGGPGGGER
jgi:outer membrane protein, heavy metal efflux system